jgi:hypothetical protein
MIEAKKSDIAKTKALLYDHTTHQNYLITCLESELDQLTRNLELCKNLSDYDIWKPKTLCEICHCEDSNCFCGMPELVSRRDDYCDGCHRISYSCNCMYYTFESEDKVKVLNRLSHHDNQLPENTKLKWYLDNNNYRIALVTATGILQIYSMTNGILNTTSNLDYEKYPTMTHFQNEWSWRYSLPDGGVVSIAYPTNSLDCKLNEPLVAETDPLKLLELMNRFKTDIFFLATDYDKFRVDLRSGMILLDNNVYLRKFSTYPSCLNHNLQPRLMVYHENEYLDLSHLF